MRHRILVIDDELGPRESFRMLLKDRFEIVTAATGAEGLAALAGNGVALVFLDVRMPDMDGIAVLAELRRLRPDVPVIMVTAYAATETMSRALAMGAMDCLIKPFNRRDVDRLIQRALESPEVVQHEPNAP